MRPLTHRSSSALSSARFALPAVCVALAACGGAPPPQAPVEPPRPVAVAVEPPPDVTAVPEPAGLLVVGRVNDASRILKTVSGWVKLPLPGGTELVRSISDEAVADVVDLSQPIDGAVALAMGPRGLRDPKALVAVSVAVRSFDEAKARLGRQHPLTPAKNGEVLVEGIGRAEDKRRATGTKEDEDEADSCVLAHASSGARLICGEREATLALSAYLSRTLPRQVWRSDVHVELTLGAVKGPLAEVRKALPLLGRSMLGGASPALGQLVESGVNELANLVDDTSRVTLDAQVSDAGLEVTTRIDFQRAESLVARLATSNPQRADAPPPAFLHLPADTDSALYGMGSDPRLLDHAKELLANVALESTEREGMPEAERKAVRELVIDRMLGLFSGPVVYGKGYDAAAVDRAMAARRAIKSDDLGGKDEAERVLAEQVLGWHLVRVSDPIAKVGPVLKDWAQLWGRAAFVKWAKQRSSSKMLATMRITGAPAQVALPTGAVHLEIVMPRSDLEALAPAGAKGKKIPRKPVVLHVLAVPDQGGTWLGFGLDARLLAQKAASALSTAPDASTLGRSPAAVEALRDVKASGAMVTTLRGLLVFTAPEHGGVGTPYAALGQVSSQGASPVLVTFLAQGPNEKGAGGSAVSTLKLPRAAIEDLVQLSMSR
jgi:hypothetical protein